MTDPKDPGKTYDVTNDERLNRLLSERLSAHLLGKPLPDTREKIFTLLKHGANINYQDRSARMTPLMHAASVGDLDLVREFLLLGADVDIKDEDGYTALDYAIDHDHKKVALFLSRAKDFLKTTAKAEFMERMKKTPMTKTNKKIPVKKFKGFKK